jgi:molybdopterin synthase catalytic subunit
MKALLIFALALVTFAGTVTAQTDSKDAKKELKEDKKALQEKSIKSARKEAKEYEKAGWYVQPGSLPLDKQIEKAWLKQNEETDKGFPAFYVGAGNAVSGTQSAAKIQASSIAKQDLAGKISSSIAAIIETNIGTQQLTAEDAATIQETVSASTEIIAQKLGSVVTLTELYRKVNANNIECNLRLAYSQEMANEEAKKAIKKELEQKTNIAREKLDQIMNF